MNTPLSTPVRQAKFGAASAKSFSLANEYKKLFNEQYQRLWMKHQQDLDLIDDIRGYVKARLSIEREYTSALSKLAKQHSAHIGKKFSLLNQCDNPSNTISSENELGNKGESYAQIDESDSRLQKRLANNGLDEPDKPCSLYKVWLEHINRLQSTSKNRADQFEQLIMVVDKLKDIRSHKATIGKKCLDTHLKRIHEDVVASMVDVEKARKLYYEDESQAKKARENEEKIKKKRSGLLTKFTDLQAKKEKTSAQREANDIQSTQARNDYIMALAAGNAHLQHYYQRDLTDFIHLIDDGVLDHCKIFMATLSECDINSLKDALTRAQYWSKMINLTGSQKTNSIFLDCEQSICLKNTINLVFEPCNDDQIQSISLEHNADYALQHEIDKWFTWFKKECRNLSQLIHQLEKCQRAFAEGKKSIELNGQTTEDLEPKIIELKQQIRKSEAAKLKAQARLKVIKEGGMQIEEWSAVESEIRADMARAQEELEAKRAKELVNENSAESDDHRDIGDEQTKQTSSYVFDGHLDNQVQLQVSKESDDSDDGGESSLHNLASVSRSTSNLMQKQQNAITGYSALTDPSLVWQDDYSSVWGGAQSNSNYNVVVTYNSNTKPTCAANESNEPNQNRYDLLGANNKSSVQNQANSMTVQSSSPLSAIVDGAQTSSSPYQGTPGEAYKSDYECDYNRTGHLMRSTASSAEPYNQQQQQQQHDMPQTDPFGKSLEKDVSSTDFRDMVGQDQASFEAQTEAANDEAIDASALLNKRVIGLYTFEKMNEDDLAFNENEILRVTEVNDAKWLKAVNEFGEEGYIPALYIRVLDGTMNSSDINNSRDGSDATIVKETELNITSMDSDSAALTSQQGDKVGPIDQCHSFCRALYDYDADTYEDDGLPHLALLQGELMRIINQGEDDGWWLVEKEETGTRGYVPSMLVEEVDLDAEDDEHEDVDGSDYSVEEDDLNGSVKAMPSFEPPVLEKSPDEDASSLKEVDVNNNELADTVTQDEAITKPKTDSSLIPTSYIIIEPTPEVESRRVEDSIVDSNQDDVKLENNNLPYDESRRIIRGTTSKPPNDVSYSIINEEFVLEGPMRRPSQHKIDHIPHHETPTILEENFCEETSEGINNNDLSLRTPDGNYEPLSEVDSIDIPAPPSVVIESFEDDKQNKSTSSDEGDIEDERSSSTDYEQVRQTFIKKTIKHTGNVDVDPILRHRADEFCKQIIAEAIMLAPGANVGPSTSSAYIS